MQNKKRSEHNFIILIVIVLVAIVTISFIFTSINKPDAKNITGKAAGKTSASSICNDGNRYRITSPNSVYYGRIRRPTSYIIPGGSIKLGIKNIMTGTVDYSGAYEFLSNSDKIAIHGNVATDIVRKYDDYDMHVEVSIPALSKCKNVIQPMLLMTGDPFIGNNIAFIYPKSIVPAQVLSPGQPWATMSVGEMMQKFDFVRITDLAYTLEKQLFGIAPFTNDVVFFGLMPPWCGNAGQPTGFGVGCLVTGANDPHWGVVYHELGHDFTSHFLLEFIDGIGGSYPTHRDIFVNWTRFGNRASEEGIATLAWLYSGYHLITDPYGIPENIRVSIKDRFLADTNTYTNDLSKYEAKLSTYDANTRALFDALMNANILDGMFIRLANDKTVNPYGWELYPKVFKLYLDPLPSFITGPLTEIQGHTYFIAGLSAASGHDLRPQFRKWGFPIDDTYYDAIYQTVATIVNPTTCVWQDPGLTVYIGSGKGSPNTSIPITVMTGDTINATLVIENRNDLTCDARQFFTSGSVPNGWTTRVPYLNPFTLRSHEIGYQNIEFTVPPTIAAGTYNAVIEVKELSSSRSSTESRSSTVTLAVTVKLPTPFLSSLLPSQGPIGTRVTLTGSGFAGDNTIHIVSAISPPQIEGTIRHVASSDGRTITFPFPLTVNTCGTTPVCQKKIVTGAYLVSIGNQGGRSEAKPFTVIPPPPLPPGRR